MFQKENLLPTVFQILGFAALSTFVFMGLMYNFNDIKIVALITVVGVFLVALLSYYLFFWKTKKKRGNDEYSNKMPETILGGGYLIIGISLYVLSNHYFNIEFSKKDVLKTEAGIKANNFTQMLSAYQKRVNNKVQIFEIQVKDNQKLLFNSNINTKNNAQRTLDSLLQNHYQDITEINKALESKKEFIANRQYDNKTITKDITDYLNEFNSVFSNWQITKLKYSFETVDNVFDNHYNNLKKKMPDFEFKPTNTTFQYPTISSSFSTASFSSILLGLIIYLVAHIFILGKYLFTKRVNNNLVDGPRRKTSVSVTDLYKTKK
jgi:hypothetical protein